MGRADTSQAEKVVPERPRSLGGTRKAWPLLGLCKAFGVRNATLLRGLVFAEAFQAVAQTALQRQRRVGIEGHQVPQRLAAVAAQPRERGRVRIRMARDVFANRAVRMLR